MPVKRRLGKQRENAISPTTIGLYARALELRALGADFREEAHEAQAAVERALGGGIRRLWETSVFDVIDYGPSPGDPDWERATDLKRRLDEALAAARAKQTGAKNSNLSKAAAAPASTSTEGSPTVQSGQQEIEVPVRADVDP